MAEIDSLFATLPLVAPIEAFGRHDVAVAGGKGANLGELSRAGLPVPVGFVVTTRAYDDAVGATGLDQRITAALRGVDVATPEQVARASREIQEAFRAAPMPGSIADAVRGAYQSLGLEPVAARSSATAEDLPGAAFAGQQDTFLNVIGEAALLDAVRGCWASLWSERAIVYRARQGLGHEDVKLAVVVQRMVQADVAGVLFTANPVTGSLDEIVIDASPGLGEAVVAGLVTPEHLVLDRRTLAVIERRPGSRNVVVRAVPTGGTAQRRVSGDERPGKPYLSDMAAGELARLAIAVERHFAAPQDVEWAWADRRFALLQARPITTLPNGNRGAGATPEATSRPVAERSGAGRARQTGRPPPRFVAGLLGELFPSRPYPLDVTSYSRVLIDALREHMFGPIGFACPSTDEAFVEEDGVVVKVDYGIRPTLAVLFRPWLTLWRNRRYDVAHWDDDPLIAEAIQRSRELEARDLRALSWDDLLDTLDDGLAITPLTARLRHRYLPQALHDLLVFWLLLALAGQRQHFNELQTGVETKTLELNRRLEALAADVIANPELQDLFTKTPSGDLLAAIEARPAASGFLVDFRAFLEGFGNRETAVTLASLPAWRNAPEIPLGVIQSMVATDGSAGSRTGNREESSGNLGISPTRGTRARAGETPVLTGRLPSDDQANRSAEGDRRWQRARDEVLASSILGREPLRSLFRRALRNARHFPRLREDTHFYMTLGLPLIQAIFQELGRRLQLAGALDEPRDVFHLKLAELATAGRPWPPTDEGVAGGRAVAWRYPARAARGPRRRDRLRSSRKPRSRRGAGAGDPGRVTVRDAPIRRRPGGALHQPRLDAPIPASVGGRRGQRQPTFPRRHRRPRVSDSRHRRDRRRDSSPSGWRVGAGRWYPRAGVPGARAVGGAFRFGPVSTDRPRRG
ncbi:MAG: PEP/pyruvate-binding domain-containing protein [Chloroflexota bacterium]